MQKAVVLVAVLAAAAVALSAEATTISLLEQGLNDKMYVRQLDKRNETLLGPLGPRREGQGLEPAEALWFLAQWNSPRPLGGDVDPTVSKLCPPGSTWSAATTAGRVCYEAATNTYSVASNGGFRDDLKCGVEYDMFLAPTTERNGYKPWNFNRTSVAHNLAVMKNVTLSFEMGLEYSQETQRCGTSNQCGTNTPDYTYLTVGVPLSSVVAKQTIFFQILLWDSRTECQHPCEPNTGSWYFDKLPTMGVDFHTANFGQPCFRKPGEKHQFNYNLLETLRHSVNVAAAKFGADSKMEDWMIGDIYIGSGLQGSAAITYSLRDVKFEAVL